MHVTPSWGHYKNKTLVSHKLLVSEIKTSSQETVSAELTDVFLSVCLLLSSAVMAEKVKNALKTQLATKVEY